MDAAAAWPTRLKLSLCRDPRRSLSLGGGVPIQIQRGRRGLSGVAPAGAASLAPRWWRPRPDPAGAALRRRAYSPASMSSSRPPRPFPASTRSSRGTMYFFGGHDGEAPLQRRSPGGGKEQRLPLPLQRHLVQWCGPQDAPERSGLASRQAAATAAGLPVVATGVLCCCNCRFLVVAVVVY